MFEFKFSGDEIGGRAQPGVALALHAGECLGIDFAFFNDLGDEITFILKAVRGDEGRKIHDFRSSRCGMTGHSPSLHMIYRRFGNSVGVVAQVILVVIADFEYMIGHDGAAIFQMDSVSPGAGESKQTHASELSNKDNGDMQPHSGAF